jgi:hypothetical protein
MHAPADTRWCWLCLSQALQPLKAKPSIPVACGCSRSVSTHAAADCCRCLLWLPMNTGFEG